ncbi:MAG: DUF2085 domain-containing protein [Chloroflexota bacterium]
MTTMPIRSKRLRLNFWLLKLSRRWLTVALTIIGIFAALPWVAPTLMHFGLEGPAHLLYFAYGPFCHQFAFRSYFLFGEQPAYPRAISGTTLTPYESYIANSQEFDQALSNWIGQPGRSMFQTIDEFDPTVLSYELQFASKDFFGDPQMGYKLALCERCISIYTALFFGGVLYSLPFVRRRLRPVPIWLYILLGIMPIGIDGFSQLLSYPPFNLWAPRETEPSFRLVTGALFGLMNAWLAFPYLELSFRDTRDQIKNKLARAATRI